MFVVICYSSKRKLAHPVSCSTKRGLFSLSCLCHTRDTYVKVLGACKLLFTCEDLLLMEEWFAGVLSSHREQQDTKDQHWRGTGGFHHTQVAVKNMNMKKISVVHSC